MLLQALSQHSVGIIVIGLACPHIQTSNQISYAAQGRISVLYNSLVNMSGFIFLGCFKCFRCTYLPQFNCCITMNILILIL